MLPSTVRAVDSIDDVDSCRRVLSAYSKQHVESLIECKNLLRIILRTREAALEREMRNRIAADK